MTLEELQNAGMAFGCNINQKQLDQLDTYARLLMEWNQKMNLTAIDTYAEIIEKHFYDCILPLAETEIKGKAADVGTGAGFPGLVWKIIDPSLSLSLIEPTGKRCRFLAEVVDRLSLKDVQIFNERAEEHVRTHREMYDVVTARAVASLQILSELTVPLVKVNGQLIAMKGAKGITEAQEAGNALDKLGASLIRVQKTALPSGDQRVNLFIHKDRSTPSVYPRNYGQIKKKPL